MTRKKQTAAADIEGPVPDRGGAWIRNADGTLTRDGSEDQAVPDDEKRGAHVSPPADETLPPTVPAGAPGDEHEED